MTSLRTDSHRATHPLKLKLVDPPEHEVFRVGRRHQPVFDPIPWEYSGTGRYDDPRMFDQETEPTFAPFRVIYTSTSLSGAFVEAMQRFRPGLDQIAAAGFVGGNDFARSTGVVARSWLNRHVWAQSILPRTARFVDICAGESLASLRSSAELARIARMCGLQDIDLSAVTGPERPFTQACSELIHSTPLSNGSDVTGIRYVSRFGTDMEHECWAVFDDRTTFNAVSDVQEVSLSNTALIEAMARLRLRVEE
jgi:hypothetical protein